MDSNKMGDTPYVNNSESMWRWEIREETIGCHFETSFFKELSRLGCHQGHLMSLHSILFLYFCLLQWPWTDRYGL